MSFGGFEGGIPNNIWFARCDEFNPQYTFLIKLSEGINPAHTEAFEDFHRSFGWVYKEYPKKQFQIVPFSIDKEGGVKAYLMVEQIKVDETP